MKKLFKNITIGQLFDLCNKHNYMIVRDSQGVEYGLNCRLWKIFLRKNNPTLEAETRLVSFRVCGMHEYISHKIPF